MEGFALALLIAILVLFFFQFIFDALELEVKARKLLWVFLVVAAAIYLFRNLP